MKRLTFDQLTEEMKTIPVFESRIQEEHLQEFVISTDFVIPLHLLFQKFFGEEFKAPGETPSPEDRKRAAIWGGVRPEQTMYYTEEDGSPSCAMFWPWTDGTRCTVKIAKQV